MTDTQITSSQVTAPPAIPAPVHHDEVHKLIDSLHSSIDKLGSSREVSLAKTKLEEAQMWITKHTHKTSVINPINTSVIPTPSK